MAYLHSEPNVIIHRDLKPRNVLLVNSSADHLKVGDFGLSNLIRVQHATFSEVVVKKFLDQNIMGESLEEFKSENKQLEFREELGLEEQIDGSQVYIRAVGGADKRQRIFGIGSLASQMSLPAIDSSSSNSEFQSTPDNVCMQNQIDALKACVEQQKRSAEEDRKNMVDALRKERQERKELSDRLEQTMTVIATFPGHGTFSGPSLP